MPRKPPVRRPHQFVNLRPHERVDQFLTSLLEKEEWEKGSRLPTNRELASRLKVSVPTVRAALKKLSQEGRIRARSGSGTFLVTPTRTPGRELRVSICCNNAGDLHLDLWANPIYGGILQVAMNHHPSVALSSITPGTGNEQDLMSKLIQQSDSTDGLIMFPYILPYDAMERVRRQYEERGKPLVSLNAPSLTATANFVSPNHMESSQVIGEAWRRTGRSRVFMMMPHKLDVSVSSQQKFLGLVRGYMPSLVEGRVLEILECTTLTEQGGYEAMRRYLDSKAPRPDGIFGMGDLISMGAMKALEEAGLHVPRDVSVVGGSGFNLSTFACPNMTRVQQPLEKIGHHLLEMLVARIQNRASPQPGLFLTSPLIGGTTTRAEENVILGIR